MIILNNMNEEEYQNYLLNLKNFIKSLNFINADVLLVDIALERMPKEFQAKIFQLKNSYPLNLSTILTKEEYIAFVELISKFIKIYHKRMSIIGSKVLLEPKAFNYFYSEFTIKNEFARSIFNLRKFEVEDLSNLVGPILLNIERVAEYLDIDINSFQLLIDKSLKLWEKSTH